MRRHRNGPLPRPSFRPVCVPLRSRVARLRRVGHGSTHPLFDRTSACRSSRGAFLRDPFGLVKGEGRVGRERVGLARVQVLADVLKGFGRASSGGATGTRPFCAVSRILETPSEAAGGRCERSSRSKGAPVPAHSPILQSTGRRMTGFDCREEFRRHSATHRGCPCGFLPNRTMDGTSRLRMSNERKTRRAPGGCRAVRVRPAHDAGSHRWRAGRVQER